MKKQNQRNRNLAKIHMAAAAIGMDGEARRIKMQDMFGKSSAANLTQAECTRLLAEFERLGWNPYRRPAPTKTYTRPVSRLMIMLWKDLHKAGLVQHKTNQAFETWVKGQTGKATPDFLTQAEADKLIKQLKQWRKRPTTEI